jgi:MFS transporter, UMF1 family
MTTASNPRRLPANPTATPFPSDRRERVGWYFYDWANSAFFTTVISVFLGPYLITVTEAAADVHGFVYPFGLKVRAGSFWPYVVALSVVQQVIFLPVLGAVADYTQRKKMMLGVFSYVGSFATMGLYFLQGTNYLLGGALFIIANVSIGASVIFYNAFLPELAAPDQRDSVSSMGWAVGYLGGGMLLGLNLVLFFKARSLGLSETHAVRISLASAGIWCGLFTVIPMLTLRSRQSGQRLPPGENYCAVGFKQLRQTLLAVRNYPQTLLFLIAALLYNDGIHTVNTMAATFGDKELGIKKATLIIVVLMVQFVAFFGALLFNLLAKMLGTKRAIMFSLILWTGTVV